MLVTVPEETPVNELIDTAYAVEDRAGVALAPIVVNGAVTDVDGLSGAPANNGAIATVQRDATLAGVEVDDAVLHGLVEAARFRVELRARQQQQRARLASRLPLPQVELPFLFTGEIGPDEVDLLAAALVAGVDALEPAAP
jgi:hypothetical protein